MPSTLALATPQRSATEAGRLAFENGGNALDACLSAALSLAVVYPDNCALGGDLIALLSRAGGAPEVINASGPAASATDLAALRTAGDRMPIRGAAPVTVPGLLAGLRELWVTGAALTWEDAFAVAISQARDGVPVVPTLAASLTAEAEALAADPGCREVFFTDGAPLREGDLLRQPALAKSLEELAEFGPEAFYRGELGGALINCLRSQGSDLVRADLARFVPERAAPLQRAVGEMTITTAPPNSQGFLLPLVLASAHGSEERLDPLGPLANRLAAVFRSALAVRDQYLGDPAAAEMPDWLLSGGDGYSLVDQRSVQERPQPPASGDTVAIVAADDAGNSVSLIQSVFYAFGAAILDPETGILVHNRGAFFSLDPDSPNVISGGKRPAHTLMPCAVFEKDRLRAVIGTMGGSSQPQILAQVLLRLQLGDDPERAVAAPRWVVGGLGVDDPYDQILVEGRVPPIAIKSLESLDLRVRTLPDFDDRVGHVQLLVSDCDGEMAAASDPRSEGSAIVVERRL